MFFKTDVRLSGMKPQENRSVGRVEIYHDGAWGTISSAGWRKTFSKVVCRQLGLSDLGLISYKDFGPTDNEIWLEGSSITCNGNETRILDCNVSNWNCSGCNHTDDIAIACQGKIVKLGCADAHVFLAVTISSYETSTAESKKRGQLPLTLSKVHTVSHS